MTNQEHALPVEERTIAGRARAIPGAWPWIMREFGGVIPRYPDETLVAPVVTPRPLLLPSDTAGDAGILTTVFANGMRKRYPNVRGWWRSPSQFEKHTESSREQLVQCGALLREKEVPPYCWFRFACDAFEEHRPGANPTFALVYRPAVVERQRMWARHVTHHMGGHRWYGDAFKLYYGRWLVLQRKLIARVDHLDHAAVLQCIDECFDNPGGAAALVSDAIAEHTAMNEELTRRANAWACLWEV